MENSVLATNSGFIVIICIGCLFFIGLILIIVQVIKSLRVKSEVKKEKAQSTGVSVVENSKDNQANGEVAVKKSGGGKTFLAVIGAIALIVLAVFLFMHFFDSASNKDNPDGTLLTRSARNSDISFEEGTDITITLSGVLYFTPRVDIDDLQITLYFLDANRDTLTSQVKEVGDVRDGTRYSVSYSIFDLGLGAALNCEYLSWAVTGGTVSYFS